MGIEPAIFQEAFSQYGPEVYGVGDQPEDRIAYSPNELIHHSWKFWFCQPGGPAAAAIGGEYVHSYNRGDFALYAQKVSDYNFGYLQGWAHYYRTGVDPRCPDTMGSIRTLMIHGSRHLDRSDELHQDVYTVLSLNQPIGAMPFSAGNPGLDAGTLGWGWSSHSDFQAKPLYTVWKWYTAISRALWVPQH